MLPSHDQTYDQLLKSRFEQINESATGLPSQPTVDFYIDLLTVFYDPNKFEAATFEAYPLEVVLDYLRQTHKLYLNKSFVDIEASIDAISSDTSTLATLKVLCKDFFLSFRDHLAAHITEEEKDLFPYIDVLLNASRNRQAPAILHQQDPLQVMAHHDDNLEEKLLKFVDALKAMQHTEQDSFGYRMLMTRLSLFELDLRIHGRLEDEVMIPRALQLQKEVLGKA